MDGKSHGGHRNIFETLAGYVKIEKVDPDNCGRQTPSHANQTSTLESPTIMATSIRISPHVLRIKPECNQNEPNNQIPAVSESPMHCDPLPSKELSTSSSSSAVHSESASVTHQITRPTSPPIIGTATSLSSVLSQTRVSLPRHMEVAIPQTTPRPSHYAKMRDMQSCNSPAVIGSSHPSSSTVDTKEPNCFSALSFGCFLDDLLPQKDTEAAAYVEKKCSTLRYPLSLALAMAKLMSSSSSFRGAGHSRAKQRRAYQQNRRPDQGVLEIDSSHFSLTSSSLAVPLTASSVQYSNKRPRTKALLRETLVSNAPHGGASMQTDLPPESPCVIPKKPGQRTLATNSVVAESNRRINTRGNSRIQADQLEKNSADLHGTYPHDERTILSKKPRYDGSGELKNETQKLVRPNRNPQSHQSLQPLAAPTTQPQQVADFMPPSTSPPVQQASVYSRIPYAAPSPDDKSVEMHESRPVESPDFAQAFKAYPDVEIIDNVVKQRIKKSCFSTNHFTPPSSLPNCVCVTGFPRKSTARYLLLGDFVRFIYLLLSQSASDVRSLLERLVEHCRTRHVLRPVGDVGLVWSSSKVTFITRDMLNLLSQRRKMSDLRVPAFDEPVYLVPWHPSDPWCIRAIETVANILPHKSDWLVCCSQLWVNTMAVSIITSNCGLTELLPFFGNGKRHPSGASRKDNRSEQKFDCLPANVVEVFSDLPSDAKNQLVGYSKLACDFQNNFARLFRLSHRRHPEHSSSSAQPFQNCHLPSHMSGLHRSVCVCICTLKEAYASLVSAGACVSARAKLDQHSVCVMQPLANEKIKFRVELGRARLFPSTASALSNIYNILSSKVVVSMDLLIDCLSEVSVSLKTAISLSSVPELTHPICGPSAGLRCEQRYEEIRIALSNTHPSLICIENFCRFHNSASKMVRFLRATLPQYILQLSDQLRSILLTFKKTNQVLRRSWTQCVCHLPAGSQLELNGKLNSLVSHLQTLYIALEEWIVVQHSYSLKDLQKEMLKLLDEAGLCTIAVVEDQQQALQRTLTSNDIDISRPFYFTDPDKVSLRNFTDTPVAADSASLSSESSETQLESTNSSGMPSAQSSSVTAKNHDPPRPSTTLPATTDSSDVADKPVSGASLPSLRLPVYLDLTESGLCRPKTSVLEGALTASTSNHVGLNRDGSSLHNTDQTPPVASTSKSVREATGSESQVPSGSSIDLTGDDVDSDPISPRTGQSGDREERVGVGYVDADSSESVGVDAQEDFDGDSVAAQDSVASPPRDRCDSEDDAESCGATAPKRVCVDLTLDTDGQWPEPVIPCKTYAFTVNEPVNDVPSGGSECEKGLNLNRRELGRLKRRMKISGVAFPTVPSVSTCNAMTRIPQGGTCLEVLPHANTSIGRSAECFGADLDPVDVNIIASSLLMGVSGTSGATSNKPTIGFSDTPKMANSIEDDLAEVTDVHPNKEDNAFEIMVEDISQPYPASKKVLSEIQSTLGSAYHLASSFPEDGIGFSTTDAHITNGGSIDSSSRRAFIGAVPHGDSSFELALPRVTTSDGRPESIGCIGDSKQDKEMENLVVGPIDLDKIASSLLAGVSGNTEATYDKPITGLTQNIGTPKMGAPIDFPEGHSETDVHPDSEDGDFEVFTEDIRQFNPVSEKVLSKVQSTLSSVDSNRICHSTSLLPEDCISCSASDVSFTHGAPIDIASQPAALPAGRSSGNSPVSPNGVPCTISQSSASTDCVCLADDKPRDGDFATNWELTVNTENSVDSKTNQSQTVLVLDNTNLGAAGLVQESNKSSSQQLCGRALVGETNKRKQPEILTDDNVVTTTDLVGNGNKYPNKAAVSLGAVEVTDDVVAECYQSRSLNSFSDVARPFSDIRVDSQLDVNNDAAQFGDGEMDSAVAFTPEEKIIGKNTASCTLVTSTVTTRDCDLTYSSFTDTINAAILQSDMKVTDGVIVGCGQVRSLNAFSDVAGPSSDIQVDSQLIVNNDASQNKGNALNSATAFITEEKTGDKNGDYIPEASARRVVNLEVDQSGGKCTNFSQQSINDVIYSGSEKPPDTWLNSKTECSHHSVGETRNETSAVNGAAFDGTIIVDDDNSGPLLAGSIRLTVELTACQSSVVTASTDTGLKINCKLRNREEAILDEEHVISFSQSPSDDHLPNPVELRIESASTTNDERSLVLPAPSAVSLHEEVESDVTSTALSDVHTVEPSQSTSNESSNKTTIDSVAAPYLCTTQNPISSTACGVNITSVHTAATISDRLCLLSSLLTDPHPQERATIDLSDERLPPDQCLPPSDTIITNNRPVGSIEGTPCEPTTTCQLMQSPLTEPTSNKSHQLNGNLPFEADDCIVTGIQEGCEVFTRFTKGLVNS